MIANLITYITKLRGKLEKIYMVLAASCRDLKSPKGLYSRRSLILIIYIGMIPPPPPPPPPMRCFPFMYLSKKPSVAQSINGCKHGRRECSSSKGTEVFSLKLSLTREGGSRSCRLTSEACLCCLPSALVAQPLHASPAID